MSRNKKLRLLAAATVIGSFICFYATNLVLSDVANTFMSHMTLEPLTSMPLFTVAIEFVLLAIGIIRNERRPEYRKAQLRRYALLAVILSCAGLVCTVLSAALVYGSLTAPYPFRGYMIICGIWHIVIIAFGIKAESLIKKLPDDPKIRRHTVRYSAHTVFLTAGMFFAFDRFGALLWMPVYVHTRSLCITWPFYLSLLLPLAVVADNVIYAFGLAKGRPDFGMKYALSMIVADIILGTAVIVTGMNNSLFISAISPALGLERLATFPIDTILHYGIVLLLGLYSLTYALKNRKVQKYS